jgi:ligand-binding sensor domain-containing protein
MRAMTKTRILILFFLYLSTHLHAGSINLSHLTVKDGLLNSTVYFAMQDTKGFMWFCTETGVSRYDGRKFENFTMNDGLADNVIFKCFEDSRHRIWFLSYNGRLSFYRDGKIHNSDDMPYLSYKVTGAYLLQATEDGSGDIWIATSYGNVIKVNDSNVIQYEPLYFDRHHGDYFITSVLFKENDSVKKFFVDPTTADLYIQNLASGKTGPAGKFPAVYKQKKKVAGGNFCHKSSTFFLNDRDFVAYNGNGEWQVFDLEKYGIHSNVLSFLHDDHYLWIATDGQGVFKIDLTTRTLTANLLREELVIKIIRDSEQNLWFITYNNGVFVLKDNSQLFATINTQITYSTCSIEYNSQSYLVAGNYNGMIYIICNGEIQKSFRLSERKFNRVLDIIPIGGPAVMIGCDGGLYEYDVSSGKKTDRTSFLQGYKNFAAAPDSSIWFCSHDRIAILKHGKFSIITNSSLLLKYTAIAVASDSAYYAGTTNKLYRVCGSQLNVVLDDHILKTQVTGLKIANGFLWVATHGNGLFILKNDKVLRHITKADNGIVSDICEKLYDDGGKYMWLATNEGMSVIGRSDFKLISNINSDAGIISNDIKNISTGNGNVYAATSAGTSIFKLAEAQFQSNPPAVYVTRYNKGNEAVIDPAGKIVFDYFKGFITLSFTAITFQSAHNLQYEYKFAGDAEWHRTSATDIPFFSLSPGTHSLMFRAKKYNSNWSSPVFLDIMVNPAWYQSVWFRIAVGLLLVLAIYYTIHVRLKAIKRKANEAYEHNRKIRELESKALISQMNPHFIFNSLNTVQQLILVKEEEQSLNFLSDFSMLMRQMLENSRKQLISLAEEFDFLDRYLQLEAIRFNNRFHYSISVEGQLVPDEIKIPPVLLQPLLENAIKHGISSVKTHGSIKLSVRKENDFLLISVEDNGIGIDTHKKTVIPHHKKESKALIVLEERLKLIKNNKGQGSSMKIVDRNNSGDAAGGTLIELRIPILV